MPTVNKTVAERAAASFVAYRPCKKRLRSNTALPSRFRNRPAPVRAWIYKVWEKSADLGFTRATTRVLQAILATGVSPSAPFAPVFARKTTLARMAECAEVTVYRAMNQLENDGWIQRNAQVRLEDGSMDIGCIQITEKLASLLGIVDCRDFNQFQIAGTNCKQAKGEKTVNCYNVEEKVSGSSRSGSPVEDQKQPSGNGKNLSQKPFLETQMKDGLQDGSLYTKDQKGYQRASVNHQSPRARFLRMDGRSVAEDLVWLITERRLTYGGLFELQKLAKRVPGQMLSDFVALRSDRIRALPTTADCYRYLKSLITQGIDAKYLRNQMVAQANRERRIQQRKAAAESRAHWICIRDRQTYLDPRTNLTYMVNANQSLVEVGEGGMPSNRPSKKITGAFIKAVEERRFVPYVPEVKVASRETAGSVLASMLTMLKVGGTNVPAGA